MKKFAFLTAFLLLITSFTFSQDQGMTSETHRKNVGKILWAKERIKPNIQDQVTYHTSFDASEPLYGRVFLEKSLPRVAQDQGCVNNNSNFQMKLYIDEVDKGIINTNYFPGGQTWTTCQVNLNLSAGDEVDMVNLYVPEKWAEVVKNLSIGTHICKIEFYGYGSEKCQKKLAEGSFTLNKTGEITPGTISSLPVAKKNDSALEASMIKAIKEKGWQNESPIKVVIIENDWRIIKDMLGTILRREINTNVILKKNDGSCRLTDISFSQEYKGSGKYGITEVYGIGTKNIPFDCSAVK